MQKRRKRDTVGFRRMIALKDDRKYGYDQAYLKQNVKNVVLPFNKRKPDDMTLLAWLNRQIEGKTKYIKRLIREDMEKK